MIQKIIALLVSVLVVVLAPAHVFAQNGQIKGRVVNAVNNEPVPFAAVIIQGTTSGATSDLNGNYLISNLRPGTYNLEVSVVGFKRNVVTEVSVQNARPTSLDIRLEEEQNKLDQVEIVASPFTKTAESPLSVRTVGIAEIQRNPGGNRDISKVIQALPGVAAVPSFRNDIIIRGGAPSENRFYLDGIEVPNINHFATQGASGGPVGLINVNFIKQVDFYSSAFPVSRGNALSSVLDFKQKKGRDDKVGFTILAGSSDLGLTVDGPVSPNSTFIFSVRRSYLQFLFKALELPFLPTYNDVQFKTTINLNTKNKITLLGLGAIDEFELNKSANETELQQYLLNNLPVNEQWNYTVGAKYEHFREKSNQTWVLSRNHLNNSAVKYRINNENDPDGLLLNYESEEIENKFRLEEYYSSGGYTVNYGINYEFATYRNSTFNQVSTPQGLVVDRYKTDLNLHKYGAFGQVAKALLNNRLSISGGFRIDGNSFSDDMNNPLEQLSPRVALSYQFLPRWSVNASTGRYFQLPAYTVLGYRNNFNELVNKQNNVTYIQADHFVAGVEYNTDKNGKITVEAFRKNYSNYPFLLRDSISLANLGSDFGVIGDAPVASVGEGRAQGVEVLLQQKLLKGYYGILAYTFVRSEFKDRSGNYRPASWDSRHIISLTGGKQLPKNWETGFKFRYASGTPYTPYAIARSSKVAVWDVAQRGLPDYTQLNSERIPAFHQLDIRVDKKYFFPKWTLNVYLDVQNVYGFEIVQPPYLVLQRDASGQPILTDSQTYATKLLENTSGTVLPSIGIQVDF